MSGERGTCCACGTPTRRAHTGWMDQVCWRCADSPDVMAELELRGARAMRFELEGQPDDNGILFDPREGEVD